MARTPPIEAAKPSHTYASVFPVLLPPPLPVKLPSAFCRGLPSSGPPKMSSSSDDGECSLLPSLPSSVLLLLGHQSAPSSFFSPDFVVLVRVVHCAEVERRRRATVEVIMPEPNAPGAGTASSSASGGVASASSAAPDAATLAEKAIAALPSDLAAEAVDPKRKAKSQDPGWKYGWWPDPTKKDFVRCIFCKKTVPAGIKRFKQHLAGGYGDVVKCRDAPEVVSREMNSYLKKNSRSVLMSMDEEGDADAAEEGDGQGAEPQPEPSSGTKVKQAKKRIAQSAITSFVVSAPTKPQTQKHSKSVSSMLCKTPEEVVAERHKSKASQPTLEHCTKKGKEAKKIVDDHVADFFYENDIPLNAINSRSWEIMLESIGQYGPGYRSPSYHEIRNPLLERGVDRTTTLRKKHEEAWKEYGCTLMSDGWTDTRQRHLINFLANSPAGTFFLGSVDASSQVANAKMLADLLEKEIDKVGKENVVQVVTDNGANFKAAGRILMERIPHLFWTPCAAHCLDLLLEDIGKIKEFKTCINNAKKVSRFIYKHGRLLDQMREKIGGDLVRPAVTRFATSFLTLASMHRHRNGLRNLFVSEEWHATRFPNSAEGKQVENIVLSMPFWNTVENCLRASQPLLIALRIADGDETPGAPEIMAAMDVAKTTIKESLKDKPRLLAEVLDYYEKRWENQMEQKLYGAALYLNPGKFFVIRDQDRRQAARLRSMFNDVLWKMISDENEQTKISKQADDYERSEGDCFSKQGAIRDRDRKNPSKFFETFSFVLLSCLVLLSANNFIVHLYLYYSLLVGFIWWPSI